MASAVSSRFAAGSPSTGVSWQQATTVVSTASTSWPYLLPLIGNYPRSGRATGRPGMIDIHGQPWGAPRDGGGRRPCHRDHHARLRAGPAVGTRAGAPRWRGRASRGVLATVRRGGAALPVDLAVRRRGGNHPMDPAGCRGYDTRAGAAAG